MDALQLEFRRSPRDFGEERNRSRLESRRVRRGRGTCVTAATLIFLQCCLRSFWSPIPRQLRLRPPGPPFLLQARDFALVSALAPATSAVLLLDLESRVTCCQAAVDMWNAHQGKTETLRGSR